MQREREAALTGEKWMAIGDRSGGREKWNEQSRKRSKICGAEGLDKSVITKKTAESRVRAFSD